MKKTITCFLIFALLLLSSVGALSACTPESDDTSDTVSGAESVKESGSASEPGSESDESESNESESNESESESDQTPEPPQPDPAPSAVITEICYNATYRENTYNLDKSVDMFEYIEISNPTEEPVSLRDWTVVRRDGYEGSETYTNHIYAASDSEMTLAPGGVAILAIYSSYNVKIGLGYATDEEIEAFRAAFCEFYGVEIPSENFYVCPHYQSGVNQEVSDAFNLPNKSEVIAYELHDKENELVSEVEFSAAYWNKDGYSCHFAYENGGSAEGHPNSVKVLGCSLATPYFLRANQIYKNPALAIPAGTDSVRVIEYNISAEGADWVAEGVDQIRSMEERMYPILDRLEEYDADILVLPEVNGSWVNYLTDEGLIGGTYSAFGRSAYDKNYTDMPRGDAWELCNLILWKTERYDLLDSGYFWFSEYSNRWSNTWMGNIARNANWVILQDKITGCEIFVLGLHLDTKSEEIRVKSVELLLEKVREYAGDRPVILTGDWNTATGSESYNIMEASEFADAAWMTTDTWVGGSYNKYGTYAATYQTRLPIDHAFVSEGLVFVERYLCDTVEFGEGGYGSDHNMMIRDFEVVNIHAQQE